MRRKIIIDCDPGQDDAMAILMLEKSRLFEILAVTTVAGNNTIQNTTNNARYTLDLAKSKSPLYSGAKRPLTKKLVIAQVHGKGGLAGAKVVKQEKLTSNAAGKIAQLISKYPNKVTIIALGPLTNIATLIQKYPNTKNLIEEIIIMGGAIREPGNQTEFAEFNIFVDPKAAKIVFESELRKILVPLEVCNMTGFTIQDFSSLKNTPIYDLMYYYQKGLSEFTNLAKIVIYDAVAAYYPINPKAFTTKQSNIKVITRGQEEGRTVDAENSIKNCIVAQKINKNKFKRDFLEIIKRR